MAEVPGELIYQLMQRMHSDLATVKREIEDARRENQAIRTHMVGLQQDITNIYAVLGNHGDARERLDASEPAE